MFKPLSTMINEGDNTEGTMRPIGKIIYSVALRKEDIQNLHSSIANGISAGGEAGVSLKIALDTIFDDLRNKGLASETINVASDFTDDDLFSLEADVERISIACPTPNCDARLKVIPGKRNRCPKCKRILEV